MWASQVLVVVKILPAHAGDIMRLGFDPWMGRHGNPLQSSCLENPMDREAWWATVHRVSRVGHN